MFYPLVAPKAPQTTQRVCGKQTTTQQKQHSNRIVSRTQEKKKKPHDAPEAASDLGRGVKRRSDGGHGHVAVDATRAPEVGDLGARELGDKDVGRLEVPVEPTAKTYRDEQNKR